MGGLTWGRHYLMCPPDHFAVSYEINPWMHREVTVDIERAHDQWNALVEVLREAGATIDVIPPEPGLPDMVFTANGGLIGGRRFVQSRFAHPERAGEAALFARWFAAQGFEVVSVPPGTHLEGAGDALVFGGRLLGGYRSRSDFAAHTAVSKLLDVEVLTIELTDPRFYHLDLTFCPLDDRHALVAPDAWDRYGQAVVRRLVPEPVVLDLDESLAFCANSVVVGSTVVMPSCTPRLRVALEDLGFDPVVTPVGEFLKAGGGVRCLTLALDVAVAPPPEA